VSVSDATDELLSDRDSTTAGPPSSALARLGRLTSRIDGRFPDYEPPVYRRPLFLQILVFAVVLAAFGSLWSQDIYRLGVLTTAMTFAIAAVGLYFAYSLGGMFAFSQGAFMGLGAYVSAQLAARTGFLTGFVGAIVVTFLVALVLGTLLRRARHLYFAVAALGFAEVMVLLFRNWTPLAGDIESGALYAIPPPSVAGYDFVDGQQVFWFMLAVTCAVLVCCALVERSPVRRNALATKQIPSVAEASGVPIYTVAILLFGFGSALAGIAGSLAAHTLGSITPDAFTVGVAINIYLMILLGGLRSMWGAVVGAFFVVWLPELLRPVQDYQTVVFSLLLLVTIIVLPNGIVGTLGDLARKVVRRASSQ
jgi:branched-chain amino acid transport system permease protein